MTIRKLNKNNFKNLLHSIDIPCTKQTRETISKIFLTATNITLNQITDKPSLDNDKKTIQNKESLIKQISEMDKSDKEILTLVLYKIIHEENFNVAPIEWLTAESLLNLITFSYDCVFPITGENLFCKWCYVYQHNLTDEIETLKQQINNISLPAKIIIYHEVIKWQTKEFKENNFDLFLSFLSFLHEEEINTILLNEKKAV